MKRSDLIDLYNDIEEAVEERRRLGDFDANSKHVRLLMEAMQKLVAHGIEQMPKERKK